MADEKPEVQKDPEPAPSFFSKIKEIGLPALATWIVVAGLAVYLVFLLVNSFKPKMETSQREEPAVADQESTEEEEPVVRSPQTDLPAPLPPFDTTTEDYPILRNTLFDTVIPERPGDEVVEYTVEFGDSVFGIAADHDITPETLLWANYDVLNDNPDFLEPGMVLKIPPVNGVYYQWKSGDTLEIVAEDLLADEEDILLWPGNKLDLVNPQIAAGDWVMVPDGQREFRKWIIPTIPLGFAGVSTSTLGPGACSNVGTGAYGSGAFVWPSPIHEVVGNDYWSGHLALDIASGEGVQVVASDAGVVVFAGWANGGYGYMVMINHGNGYSTLYAHLSSVTANCGNSVAAGQTIGYGGTTGNSTGPHLHFEIRLYDGYVNPWYVLPAP